MHARLLLPLSGLCLALIAATSSAAEFPRVEIADPVRSVAYQAEEPPAAAPRGTLPEIEVTPPPAIPGDASEFGLPPLSDPFDLPGTFPRLGQQLLGNPALGASGFLDGAARTPLSVFELPGHATIVDRQLLDEKMAGDMYHALQYEVGVLMQQTGRGQASPFLRGLTGQQILVLIDGVRMNNSVLRAGPNQYFNTIDPGRVERIEVVRGTQSVLWGGDALGGVINVVTRGADPLSGGYTGGGFRQFYGTADGSSYSRANVEGWIGSSGVFAGASYLNVLELDRGGGRGAQNATDYHQYAGDLKYNLLLGDEALLTLSLSHFEQHDVPRSDRFAPFVQNNNPNATPRPTFFDPQQYDLAYLRLQGLAWSELPFDAYSVTLSYARTKEGTRELRSPTRLDVGEFDVDTVGATAVLTKDLDGLGRFTYGVDYYRDEVDSFRQRFNPSNILAPPTPDVPQYPADAVYDRFGAFLNWDVAVTDRLTALAGVRYENVDAAATPTYTINNVATPIPFERNYNEWVASLGLNYLLTDDVALVGGVYEGFRAPTIDDLTADKTFLQEAQSQPLLDNLNVRPERSITYEIGVKFDTPRLRVQIFEWWTQIENNITREIDQLGNTLLVNREAYLNGTEVSGEYLLTDEWSLYGNFWYTYGLDRTVRQPFSRTPPTQGVLGLRWREIDRRAYVDVFTWLVRRQDRYADLNLTDARFPTGGQPGYATLNLRAGARLGACDQHRVSLLLENITDEYFRVLGSGVDGPGFNAVLGYEYAR